MTSPIERLIDEACFRPTKEGEQTFHAEPCHFCGADGDDRGVCCDAWVKLSCLGCKASVITFRILEDGDADVLETDTCPECKPG